MPVDYDDVETDNADGENKVIGESFVDLDYKSNIKLAKDFLNKTVREENMLPEKSEEELEALMAKITLTEDLRNSEKSEKPDDPDEIHSRAPVGGIPVTFANNFIGVKALKNGPAFDANYNNYCNSYSYDSKPKRSYNESEFHAVKYKKPTDNSNSLSMQCAQIPDFLNHNVIINTHQPSGGIVTINPCPSMASSEEYDSSFSPGESLYDSSPPPVSPVVSPSSDYSSMASPENLEPSFIEVTLDCNSVKKESSDCDFDVDKLDDVNDIIEKDLNSSRIKEEKERLEKELRSDDGFVAASPPQYVPGQGSMPSSSPTSLYNNPELHEILEDLLDTELAFSQQQEFTQPQPSRTTYMQSHQMVNPNHRQFPQQQPPLVTSPNHLPYNQQPPLVTSPNHLPYNLQTQQTNVLSNLPPQQRYSAQQIITSTGNQTQYVVTKPQVNGHLQQPVLAPSLFNQQNQLSAATTVSSPLFISQQQSHMTQSGGGQYPVALQSVLTGQPQETQITTSQHQYAVQPQSQIITTTPVPNQTFVLPQHQTLVTSKQQYTSSPPPQRVTTPQGRVTGCAIQAQQPAISQLPPVVQKPPSSAPAVTPKTSVLPSIGAPEPNGIVTPVTSATANSPNNAVIIVAQTANSQNPIMFVPTTSSQLIYMSPIPVSTKNKMPRPAPRTILPKPAGGDPNGNRVDPTKLPASGKGRRDKDKSLQQTEIPGQGNLGVARRCVAAMRDEHLENTSDDGDNYLHVAVCKTDVYMIEALLERLDRSGKLSLINEQNNAGQTPVYLAVSANQPAMVHKLIRYGADVNIKGMMRGYQNERVERAPIHCAASKGKEYYDTLKELFKSETIDPDILNSDGHCALHCAIIEHGKLIPNQNFRTTKIDNCQNVALLLKNRANPNLPDRRHGKTPLMYALETKDYAMVETIFKGVESSKIPELLSAKTFDRRTCVRIAEGLRNEYDPQTWRKLQNFLSSVH